MNRQNESGTDKTVFQLICTCDHDGQNGYATHCPATRSLIYETRLCTKRDSMSIDVI